MERPKLHHKYAVSRRRFLFLGTAAAAAAVAAPYVELSSAPLPGLGCVPPFTEVVIPTRQLLARLVISGPVLEASRYQCGAFLRALREESERIVGMATRDLERELSDRRTLSSPAG